MGGCGYRQSGMDDFRKPGWASGYFGDVSYTTDIPIKLCLHFRCDPHLGYEPLEKLRHSPIASDQTCTSSNQRTTVITTIPAS